MSEIEKMKLYQNAGIEPTYTDECIIANNYWRNEELANEYGTFDKFMERNCKFGYQDCTDECEYAYTKTHYPPFTAEKQIKIMELLGEVHTFFDADKTNFACITNYRIGKGIIKGYEGKGESVSEALASLVNNLWQDLTEEQKQQVKGILE
jgi:hypothetical protein